VRADDRDAVLAAVIRLARYARTYARVGHVTGEEGGLVQRAGSRPLRWALKVLRLGPIALLYLDCEGYADVPYAAHGLLCPADEPLAVEPDERHYLDPPRRGPEVRWWPADDLPRGSRPARTRRYASRKAWVTRT
jgi:hypothetical protein